MQRLSTEKKKFFQAPDWITLLLYLALVILGLLSIYSVSYDIGDEAGIFGGGRITSQLIWFGLSLGVALIILLLDRQFIQRSSPIFYVAMVLLLIATIFLAPNIKGSHSWLVITNSIRIQPAEFAKVSTAMMLAWWTSQYEFNIKRSKDLTIAFLIFLVPMLIIILQSETGSALVFLSFIIVLYREGLLATVPLLGIFLAILFILVLRFSNVTWGITPADRLLSFLLIYIALFIGTEMMHDDRKRPITRLPALIILPSLFVISGIVSIFQEVDFSIPAIIALALLIIMLLWFSITEQQKSYLLIALVGVLSVGLAYGVEYFFEEVMLPHQQNRILVSLGMKDDPSGAGYNVRQSLIAIGSGGFWGKGYMQGTQTKLSYVPEQDTDFIFCTIGEEFGFLGAALVLVLYLLLLLRVLHLAEQQKDTYGRVYGYSVAAILFFHLFVNIGMVIGFIPVIGIPLPFFSYGGSSLLSFTILLFILLRLDATNPR